MLKYFIVTVTSISYFISIANIANAEAKEPDCNAIKFDDKDSNINRRFDCKPSEAEIKIFYTMLKEKYTKQNKEGDGTSSVEAKKLNLPESTKSEYSYMNFYEAKNAKIVGSHISSNGSREVEVEISEITTVYKRTQTFGKLGESHFKYEFKTEFLSKGRAYIYSHSISQGWKFSGGLGHS